MTTFTALFGADAKSIRRDALLRWMVFIPVFSALLLRWLLPYLATLLQHRGIHLFEYYPLIFSYFFVLVIPMMFGTIVGFILLDEREDDTLTALRVTPLPLRRYLLYRLSFGVVFSVLFIFIAMPLAGFSGYNVITMLPIALLGALAAPLFAFLLPALAANKVEGFAVVKFTGIFLVAPVAAYFMDSGWQLLFGILPTYWPVKCFWLMTEGESFLPYLLAGAAYHALLVYLLLKRFEGRLKR